MAIIIPSKKIYNISNPKVIENALKEINIEQTNAQIYYTNKDAKHLKDVLDLSAGEVGEIRTVDRNDDRVVNDTDMFAAGLRVDTTLLSTSISLPRLYDDYYIIDVAPTIEVDFDVTISSEGASCAWNTQNGLSVAFKFGLFDDARDSRQTTAKNYEFSASDLSYVWDKKFKMNSALSILPDKFRAEFSVSDNSVSSGDNDSLIAKMILGINTIAINDVYPYSAQISRTTKDTYSIDIQLVNKIVVWFSQDHSAYESNKYFSTIAEAIKIEMVAKEARIVYNESIRYLSAEKQRTNLQSTISEGEAVFSITNNPFIRTKNEYSGNNATEALYRQTLNTYFKGKETAIIRCSIGDYYDENGDIAISTKNPDKMMFEHYDKVVPMVRDGSGQDDAMSSIVEGEGEIQTKTPKVFDVVGVRIYSDGAIWQELTLRESGDTVEIPTAEKLSTPEIVISTDLLTIYSNDDRTEHFAILVNGSTAKVIDADNEVIYNLDELGLEYGSYKITVISRANGYLDSRPSNSVAYNIENPEIETLPTPLITITGETLYIFGETTNVEKFDILVNGSIKTTITNTTLDLTSLNLGVGTFEISVIAKAKGYNDSVPSESAIYIFETKTLLTSGKYVFNELLSLDREITENVDTTIIIGDTSYEVNAITVGKSGLRYMSGETEIIAHNGNSWISEEMKNVEFIDNIQVTTTFFAWFAENATRQKIQFKIGDKTYYAEDKMTWYRWCNSVYNDGNWLVKGNTATERIYRYSSATIVETVFNGVIRVSALDIILNNTDYVTREEFSDDVTSEEILEYVEENYVTHEQLDEAIGDIDFSEFATKKELADINAKFDNYDTSEEVSAKITTALVPYATMEWVEAKKYTTDAEVREIITTETTKIIENKDLVNEEQVNDIVNEAIEGIEIEKYVTTEEVNKKFGSYSTTEQMQTEISTAIGGVEATVSSKFDGLQIGGRNIYTNTADFGGDKWVNIGNWAKDSNLDGFGNVIMYKNGQWGGLHQRIAVKSGEEYTLSATVFGDGNCTAIFYVSEFDSSGTQIYGAQVKDYDADTLSSSGTRIYATYKVLNTSNLSFRIENSVAGAKIKISSLKLEKGNKATDWTAAPEDEAQKLAKVVTNFDGKISELQDQIDGVVDTWFGNGAPTLENEPAVNWTTDEDKANHLGDTYYDNDTGYGYRWQIKDGNYLWVAITSADALKALEAASKAQDTADSKRRVFVVTPFTPYDKGDLWAVTTTEGVAGDLMRCANSRASGEWVESDWVKATKYIDNETARQTSYNVLQQTQIGGRNLAWFTNASGSPIFHTGVNVNSPTGEDLPLSHRWNLTKSDAYTGSGILDSVFEVGENYTISYFFKKTAGNLLGIGGHIANFTQIRVSIDGQETTADYSGMISLADDTTAHYVVVTVKYNGGGQPNFYIQPNRSSATSVTYDLWNIKVEKGVKATDWTPAWEEYNTSVETTAKIKEYADSVTLSVKQEINANLENNYYTKTQTDSAIKIATDEINLSVSSITVGGKNLLVGSSNGEGWSGYDSFDKNTHEFTKKNSTVNENYIYCNNLFDLEKGKQYTFSFMAKSNGYVSSIDVYFLPASWAKTGIAKHIQIRNVPTNYQRYTYTFVPDENATSLQDCQLRFDNNGSSTSGIQSILYIKDIQLENGNKPTDWTPAPQDMASIDYVKSNLALGIATDTSGNKYSYLTGNADYVNFTGKQFAVNADNLTITREGTITAKNGEFSGKITSSSGEIGGFDIGTYLLQSSDTKVGMCSESGHGPWAFWAGEGDYGAKPFRVGHAGELIATKATITGTIYATGGTIGGVQIGNLATKGEIPSKTSDLTNDSGYATTSQLPSKTSQLTNDSGLAYASQIPTNTNQLTNGAGFTTMSAVEAKGYQDTLGVTTITKNTVTSDFIKTLNLEVGNQIKMGANAVISWDKVSSKPDVATKTDVSTAQSNATTNAVSQVEKKGYATTTQVSTAKNEAISTAATDATNKANSARTNAVNDVKALGYQTLDDIKALGYQTQSDIEKLGYQTSAQVTQITKNTVTTNFVNALGITAAVANIANKITVGSVFSADATQSNITLGGWTVDSNSMQYGDIGTANSMWLCSDGTHSAKANIAGSGETNGWCITVGNTFGVHNSGRAYMTGGNIAGWSIAYDGFYRQTGSGESSTYVGVRSSDTKTASSIVTSGGVSPVRFFAGSKTAYGTGEGDDAPNFRVLEDGSLLAKAANITGHIVATSGEFKGSISVNNGVFAVNDSGSVTAKKGTIGGFTLSNGLLYAGGATSRYAGLNSATDTNYIAYAPSLITSGTNSRVRFFAGSPIAMGGTSSTGVEPTFRVLQDGSLYASAAKITGHIDATSGSFAGELKAATGSFEGTIKVGAKFEVNSEGNIYAYGGKIGDWQIYNKTVLRSLAVYTESGTSYNQLTELSSVGIQIWKWKVGTTQPTTPTKRSTWASMMNALGGLFWPS